MSDDLKARVVRVLAEEVGPALDLDGTRIEVLDVSDGVAQVRLNGVCSGCPSEARAGSRVSGSAAVMLRRAGTSAGGCSDSRNAPDSPP
jgi:Fe-S cluster biogenesis protein NfuA